MSKHRRIGNWTIACICLTAILFLNPTAAVASAPVSTLYVPTYAVPINTTTNDIWVGTGNAAGRPQSYAWYMDGAFIKSGTWEYNLSVTPLSPGQRHIHVDTWWNDEPWNVTSLDGYFTCTYAPPSMLYCPTLVDLNSNYSCWVSTGNPTAWSQEYNWVVDGIGVLAGTWEHVYTGKFTSAGTHTVWVGTWWTGDWYSSTKLSAVVTVPNTPTISGTSSPTVGTAATYTVTNAPSGLYLVWKVDGTTVYTGTETSRDITFSTFGSHTVSVSYRDYPNCGSGSLTVNAGAPAPTINSLSCSPSTVGPSSNFTCTILIDNPNNWTPLVTWFMDGVQKTSSNTLTWTTSTTAGGTHTISARAAWKDQSSIYSTSGNATVTVPTSPTITGATTATVGLAGTYSVSTNVSGESLVWKVDGGTVYTGTSTSQSLTFSTAGSHTIHVSYQNYTGVTAGSMTVSATASTPTINSLTCAPAVVGPDDNTTCTILIDNPNNWTPTVSWYLDGIQKSSGSSLTWTGGTSSSGSHTVSARAAWEFSSSSYNSQSTTFTVPSSPTISGSTSPAAGTAGTYSVTNAVSAATLVWKVDDSTVYTGTSTSQDLVFSTPGSHTVSVSYQDYSGVEAGSLTVSATAPAPTINSLSCAPGVMGPSQNTSCTISIDNPNNWTPTITWYLDGSQKSSGSTLTWTGSSSGSGDHTVTARAAWSAVPGTYNAESTTFTVPSTPTLSGSASPNINEATTYTVTNAVSGATLVWSVDGTTIHTGTEASRGVTFTSFGSHRIEVSYQDYSGVSAGSLTVSTTAPAPTITSLTCTPTLKATNHDFTCQVSFDNPWEWDATVSWFFDGAQKSTGTATTWTSTTSSEGTHTVKVKVAWTLASSSYSYQSAEISVVEIPAPTVSAISCMPGIPVANQAVTCSATVTPPANGTLRKEWTVDGIVVASEEDSITQTFTTVDIHTVSLHAWIQEFSDIETTQNVSLSVGEPPAPAITNLSCSPKSPYMGQEVTCSVTTETTSQYGTPTRTWYVDSTAQGATDSITYTFTSSGNHTVSVKTGLNEYPQASNSSSVSISVVTPPAPTLANLVCTPTEGYTDTAITCSADVQATYGTPTYSWTVDGTKVATSSSLSKALSAGTRTIGLTVGLKEASSVSTNDSTTVTIYSTPTLGSISCGSTSLSVNDTLSCSAKATNAITGLSYTWTLTDSSGETVDTQTATVADNTTSTSLLIKYSKTMDTKGSYTLQGSLSKGKTTYTTKSASVWVHVPKASITMSANTRTVDKSPGDGSTLIHAGDEITISAIPNVTYLTPVITASVNGTEVPTTSNSSTVAKVKVSDIGVGVGSQFTLHAGVHWEEDAGKTEVKGIDQKFTIVPAKLKSTLSSADGTHVGLSTTVDVSVVNSSTQADYTLSGYGTITAKINVKDPSGKITSKTVDSPSASFTVPLTFTAEGNHIIQMALTESYYNTIYSNSLTLTATDQTPPKASITLISKSEDYSPYSLNAQVNGASSHDSSRLGTIDWYLNKDSGGWQKIKTASTLAASVTETGSYQLKAVVANAKDSTVTWELEPVSFTVNPIPDDITTATLSTSLGADGKTVSFSCGTECQASLLDGETLSKGTWTLKHGSTTLSTGSGTTYTKTLIRGSSYTVSFSGTTNIGRALKGSVDYTVPSLGALDVTLAPKATLTNVQLVSLSCGSDCTSGVKAQLLSGETVPSNFTWNIYPQGQTDGTALTSLKGYSATAKITTGGNYTVVVSGTTSEGRTVSGSSDFTIETITDYTEIPISVSQVSAKQYKLSFDYKLIPLYNGERCDYGNVAWTVTDEEGKAQKLTGVSPMAAMTLDKTYEVTVSYKSNYRNFTGSTSYTAAPLTSIAALNPTQSVVKRYVKISCTATDVDTSLLSDALKAGERISSPMQVLYQIVGATDGKTYYSNTSSSGSITTSLDTGDYVAQLSVTTNIGRSITGQVPFSVSMSASDLPTYTDSILDVAIVDQLQRRAKYTVNVASDLADYGVDYTLDPGSGTTYKNKSSGYLQWSGTDSSKTVTLTLTDQNTGKVIQTISKTLTFDDYDTIVSQLVNSYTMQIKATVIDPYQKQVSYQISQTQSGSGVVNASQLSSLITNMDVVVSVTGGSSEEKKPTLGSASKFKGYILFDRSAVGVRTITASFQKDGTEYASLSTEVDLTDPYTGTGGAFGVKTMVTNSSNYGWGILSIYVTANDSTRAKYYTWDVEVLDSQGVSLGTYTRRNSSIVRLTGAGTYTVRFTTYSVDNWGDKGTQLYTKDYQLAATNNNPSGTVSVAKAVKGPTGIYTIVTNGLGTDTDGKVKSLNWSLCGGKYTKAGNSMLQTLSSEDSYSQCATGTLTVTDDAGGTTDVPFTISGLPDA